MLWTALQWLAMVATVIGAWCVASRNCRRREIGFWVYLVSNALWVAWGWHAEAWALVVLQFALVALNMRGAKKNDDAKDGDNGQEVHDGQSNSAGPARARA